MPAIGPNAKSARSRGRWSDLLDRPRRLWWRRAIFQVHLWCGLVVGLLATVAGLSGSAVVYREALDRRLAPGLYSVSPGPALPLDAVIARVRLQLPADTMGSVDIESERGPWVFHGTTAAGRSETAFVDPASGRVLGVRAPGQGVMKQGLMNWLDDLHTELLGGQTGTYVNGAGAGALLLLCLTGLVVWWPGRRQAKRALRIGSPSTGRWRRFHWDLHTAGGLWISLPLALQAFTGVFLCFGLGWVLVALGGRKSDFDDLIASPKAAACVLEPSSVAGTSTGTPTAMEAMLDRARRLHPGAEDLFVVLPGSRSGGLTVYSRTAEDLRTGNMAVIGFNSCTGALLKDVDSRSSSRALRIVLLLDAFHFGLVGGGLTKAAWVLLGLTPGVLFGTGLLLWWRRAGRSLLRSGQAGASLQGP